MIPEETGEGRTNPRGNPVRVGPTDIPKNFEQEYSILVKTCLVSLDIHVE